MKLEAVYPTPEHQKAADAIVDYFVSNHKIDAVLLVNSCARGQATRDSCLDIITLARPDPARSQIHELEAGQRIESTAHVSCKVEYGEDC